MRDLIPQQCTSTTPTTTRRGQLYRQRSLMNLPRGWAQILKESSEMCLSLPLTTKRGGNLPARRCAVPQSPSRREQQEGKVGRLSQCNVLPGWFFDSKKTFLSLTHVVGSLKQACYSKESALVVTSSPISTANNWRLPKAMGGDFFRHSMNVIVHVARLKGRHRQGLTAIRPPS